MIPVFKPFAGLSPSCWAVLVQMEHCADKVSTMKNEQLKNNNINNHFFITAKIKKAQ